MQPVFPPERVDPTDYRRHRRHPRNPWNVLLLVPLLALVTPIYNRIEPTLFGVPFFYWGQILGLLLGMFCTVVVYLTGKRHEFIVTDRPDRLDVDQLDEGALR